MPSPPRNKSLLRDPLERPYLLAGGVGEHFRRPFQILMINRVVDLALDQSQTLETNI